MDGGVRAAEDSLPQDPSPSLAAMAGDANKGDEDHHQQQQQPQRQTIRWERFLPRRSLRVLLVEHDDSTRHIVAALLRKCSYHVAAVADGLKAWEVLKGKEYKFDLVLTEVEMPLLSGIGLLSKIMACELSKNIPVIMMSSHDSVNVVYKCMLKGAVDFLVKPVRRNELRNLWQHVWRKHCSTSYAQGQESINNNTVKSAAMSGNKAASNHISAIAGSMSKYKERCDDGSDTESSGCKPEGEIQSGERQRGSNNAELIISSTVVESKREEHNHKMIQETESLKHNSRDEKHNIMEVRKEDNTKEKLGEQDFVAGSAETKSSNKDIINTRKAPEAFDSNLQINRSSQVIDFLGTLANEECCHAVSEKNHGREQYQLEAKKTLYRTNGCTSDALFSWELSLRGPHLDGCRKGDSQERHTLKHSSASAFTRYCTGGPFTCQKSDSSPSVLSVTRRNSQSDKVESQFNDHVAGKEELPLPTTAWRLTSTEENEVGESNGPRAFPAGNHEDESRFTADLSKGDAYEPHTPTEGNGNDRNMSFPSCRLGLVQHLPVGGVPFQSICTGYGTYVQQVFYHDSSSGHGSHRTEKEQPSRPVDLSRPVSYNLSTSMLQPYKEGPRLSPLGGIKDTRDNEELGRRSSICSDAGQTNGCSELGPRSFMCSDPEQSNRNRACSLNILSCEVRGENGETTGETVGRGTVTENDFEIGLQNHDRKGLIGDHSRREAALVKFRLKRKDRCFEKKVRYHSRKKLAEQRPRIKGQFVRHTAVESNAATTEEDD